MTRHRDHLHRSDAQLLADVVRQDAQRGARLHDVGEEVLGDPQPPHDPFVPLVGARVHELGGGGDRIFRRLPARQQVAEEVGHEQRAAGALEQLGALLREGIELEDRVELHELVAGRPVELVAADDPADLLDHPGGAGVAVVDGVLHQVAVPVEQAEIHPPGVDADALEIAQRLRLGDALLDLVKEREHVPVEGPAHRDGVVVEAVNLGERNALPIEFPEHGTAARRAEIKCQQSLFHLMTPFSS